MLENRAYFLGNLRFGKDRNIYRCPNLYGDRQSYEISTKEYKNLHIRISNFFEIIRFINPKYNLYVCTYPTFLYPQKQYQIFKGALSFCMDLIRLSITITCKIGRKICFSLTLESSWNLDCS